MLLKRHGRRGYNKTTDSYIEDNLEVLLSVSKNLLNISAQCCILHNLSFDLQSKSNDWFLYEMY